MKTRDGFVCPRFSPLSNIPYQEQHTGKTLPGCGQSPRLKIVLQMQIHYITCRNELPCSRRRFLSTHFGWVADLFLTLLIKLHQFFRVIVTFGGYRFSAAPDSFQNVIIHGCSSMHNSMGVTRAGTNNPMRAFIMRICSNLLAFARCLQFHVNKKSHL